MEPGNEWFATGAADRVIKIWDLASGKLKLSLTGHVSTVRGLAVSPRSGHITTQTFSCCLEMIDSIHHTLESCAQFILCAFSW